MLKYNPAPAHNYRSLQAPGAALFYLGSQSALDAQKTTIMQICHFQQYFSYIWSEPFYWGDRFYWMLVECMMK